jgi:hypothetical protein
MTYLEAARRVLAVSREPLTSNEIVRRAVEAGFLVPAAKAPEDSMTSRLYVFVKANPDGDLVKVAQPGNIRVRRESVRWALRQA